MRSEILAAYASEALLGLPFSGRVEAECRAATMGSSNRGTFFFSLEFFPHSICLRASLAKIMNEIGVGDSEFIHERVGQVGRRIRSRGFSEDGRGDGNLLQLDASSKIAAINRLKKIIKQLNCQSPVFLLAARINDDNNCDDSRVISNRES